MGLKVSSKGNFDPVPAGLHHAVCYQVIDLGTQLNTMFNKRQHKVMIVFEIPGERIDVDQDGKQVSMPRAISKEYTGSISPRSNLGKDINSWRGEAFTPDELQNFDLRNVLSANCQLNVIHNSNDRGTFANIDSIVPLGKGMKKLTPENPQVIFDLDDDETIPETVPDWIQEKIHGSEEWMAKHEPGADEAVVQASDVKDALPDGDKKEDDGKRELPF